MPSLRRFTILALVAACGGDPPAADASTTADATTGAASTTAAPPASSTSATGDPPAPTTSDATTAATTTDGPSTSTSTSTTGEPTTGEPDTSSGGPAGPDVDVSDPKLHEFKFTASDADPAAALALGDQLAHLDTTVPLQGRLVVYLHGAGAQETCGSAAHGVVLARMGFHVVHPCYVSDYGVGNCDDDIEGCRLEAFEGVDHHPFVAIPPADSIETRVVRMLEHLQALHPGGDWAYFLDGDLPRWSAIVVSGISHGASTSGVIGIHRLVDRVAMLSGPLDSGQAWLMAAPLTPIDRFWAFTHTADPQHPGHLESFAAMNLVGEPALVDDVPAPWGGSHRLVTAAPTDDGHGATQAGGASPKTGDAYVYEPVWRAMVGAD